MTSHKKPVSIIVPVYGDWPSLKVCIKSLRKHVDTNIHKVILVNDCGPKADFIEEKIKASIKNTKNFFYYRNKKNLGFVGTCNRAVLEIDKSKNNVLLLNSDTKVTHGFLDEMIEVLDCSDNNGAVSPRSNNASIATIPLESAIQKGVGGRRSYDMYRKIKDLLPRYYVAPVAHGFCLLIRRDLIDKFGLFDKEFGKGYGEEVDFCLRIKKKGYLSLLANHAYVYHLEGKSFSLKTKAKLLDEHNKILWERYPDYRQSVRDYMNKVLEEEGEIQKKAGISVRLNVKQKIKTIAKRNRTTRRLLIVAKRIVRR